MVLSLSVCLHVVLPHLFLNGIYSFIFAFFVAVHGLFLVVVSGGYSLVVVCVLLIAMTSLALEHKTPGTRASVVVATGL